jgi:hypothetical protein
MEQLKHTAFPHAPQLCPSEPESLTSVIVSSSLPSPAPQSSQLTEVFWLTTGVDRRM